MIENLVQIAHEHRDAIQAAINLTTHAEAPSRIVYSPLFHTLDGPEYDGDDPVDLPLGTLRQILWELQQGVLDGGASDDLEWRGAAISAAARSGVVPMAMVDYRFEAVTEAAIKRFLVGIRETGALDLFGIDRAQILETRRLSLCRPLIETIPDGADVIFSFENDWRISNTGETPSAIVFDPGDGHGPRHIGPGGHIHVRYGAPGDKRLASTLCFEGRTATTTATLHVKALNLPRPDRNQPIMGVHNRIHATGRMKVYWAPGRSHVSKPLFMWTGFDTGATMLGDNSQIPLWSATAEDYLADPDIMKLLEEARQNGHDIVIIEIDHTDRPIQANAAMVMAGIRLINGGAVRKEPGKILTGSMGGLIARYALLVMELERRSGSNPHDIAKAVFFDSPFKGAVIPMSVQYALDYYARQGGEAEKRRDLLNVPSARQMLVQKYDPGWHQQAHPKPHPDFGEFANECRIRGDWPEHTECYAATSGSGQGLGQKNDAHNRLLPKGELFHGVYKKNGTWKAQATLWAMPDAPSGGGDTQVTDVRRTTWGDGAAKVRTSLPWDTCPGGWYDAVGQFRKGGPWNDAVRLTASNACFVPTLSALNIEPRTDLHRKPPASAPPFKEIYTPADNTKHCQLTPEVTAWIKRVLQI